MGSFSATCMISNLGIGYGDPIVALRICRPALVSLGPRSWCDTPGVNMLWPGQDWAPVGLPMRGTYDDYGRIEGVPDDAAAALTRDLHRDVDEPDAGPLWTLAELCDREVDGRDFLLSGRRMQTARTFVHRRVWDYLVGGVEYESYALSSAGTIRHTLRHRGTEFFAPDLAARIEQFEASAKTYEDLVELVRTGETAVDRDEHLRSLAALRDYDLDGILRGGEGDALHGGAELYRRDRALFLSAWPEMLALRASMYVLRRSYLPLQTIGPQEPDGAPHLGLLRVCEPLARAQTREDPPR